MQFRDQLISVYIGSLNAKWLFRTVRSHSKTNPIFAFGQLILLQAGYPWFREAGLGTAEQHG
jgi:hypothetical protein